MVSTTDHLTSLAEDIERVEAQLRSLRKQRDAEIRRRVRAGTSERDAATAANVSPSYAHRAAVHGSLAAAVTNSRRAASRNGKTP